MNQPSRTQPPPVGDNGDAALLRVIEVARATGYHFVTTTPETHRRVNARPGSRWAQHAADALGWSRPFQGGALPASLEQALDDAGLLAPHDGGWRSTLRLSSLAGLLFLHSAYPTDAADAVFFGPDTYRFADAVRSHLLASRNDIHRCVDIGCGAGPGGILAALARPRSETVLVDINKRALRLARVNARAAGADNVVVRESDLLDGVTGDFDLIIANPPYLVDPMARAYRHGGGPLGAGLSLRIVEAATSRLAPGGTLLLYTGSVIIGGEDRFRQEAGRLLDAAGLRWSFREVDPDVFGEELENPAYAEADRIAAVVLTAIKGE